MRQPTVGFDDSADASLARFSPLLRWTLFRPVTVLVLFVALLVIGAMAYSRIQVQLMPAGITTGSISVHIPVPDGTPQEVMEDIAKPCEDLLRTIPGVRSIYTSSGSSRCHLRINFDPELDTDIVVADVRERLERARLTWPEGVDRYNIWRGHMDSDMPIYIVAVGLDVATNAAGEELVDVNEVFENVIESRLLALDGVARVTFWGLVEKRVTIDLDTDLVGAYTVPVRELIERLSRSNQNITGGKLEDGDREYLVRSLGRFGSFDEIRRYPVKPELAIGDVAEVGYYRAYQDFLSRVNGKLSRVVVVHKDSMANTIEVCDAIERAMADMGRDLPRTTAGLLAMESTAFLNQGEIIALSIASLQENGAWGGVFAMLVLLVFFRRLRVTLLVALAIPFSLLMTVVWLYFGGGTFNILSLMGMSLGIGMLVDNSIVVVENIVRKQDLGLAPRAAAVEGLRDVGIAVSLATLTTVVVFLPVMFLGDPRFRAIYSEVAGPLCVSVLASLLVALVFIPQGVIHLQGRRRAAAGDATPGHEPRRRATALVLAGGVRLREWTQAGSRWCLTHRFVATLLFAGILASTGIVLERIPHNMNMSEGAGRMELRVELPPNLTLAEANSIVDRIERVFYDPDNPRVAREHGIRSITTWFDSRGGGLNLFFEEGVRVKEEEFYNRVRDRLPEIPGVRVQLQGDMFDTDDSRRRIRVFVRGTDYATLERLGGRVKRELEDASLFPELYDVAQMRDESRDEVRVTVERELAQHYGVDARSVASTVAWAIRGAMLPDYVTDDRELPFWIRYEDADKESLEELDSISVFRADGGTVRLDNVASYAIHPGPGEIRRMNGKMTVAFTADLEPTAFDEVKARVERHLERIPLPDGFEITMNPRPDGEEEDFTSMMHAGILAISLVFFVMGFLFESFILPFSVLLSIPHAFFGSVWALYLAGVPLDPVGVIGLVMLVGIVVNNAIVLVDAINRCRGEGRERTEAIIEATRVRFRPIWMTALTTIFGLLPLIILPQRGEGVDYKAMAVVLVGGLATSTFFTLFVVPLFYTILDDLRRLVLTLLLRPERALGGAEPDA